MGTMFDLMKSVRFDNVDLSDTSFFRSSLESVHFVGCEWPHSGGYALIKDELLFSPSSDPYFSAELLRLYTQLKKNFEEHRNFADAGHWFYREMEARRRVALLNCPSGWWREVRFRVFALSWWYKVFSRYGESPGRPLYWIAGIFVAFAVAYSFCGIKIGGESPTSGIADILHGAIYSLNVMTLQYGKNATATNPFGHFLSLLQLILTAIVVPLFLLAVRRKFRR
jgi:hypothetical protein